MHCFLSTHLCVKLCKSKVYVLVIQQRGPKGSSVLIQSAHILKHTKILPTTLTWDHSINCGTPWCTRWFPPEWWRGEPNIQLLQQASLPERGEDVKTKNIARSSSNFYDQIFQHLGTGGGTKTDEFSEKYQTAFDLPPSFSETFIAIFLMDTKPSKIGGTI